MRLGQILDMDVVALAGAIGRRIVAAEDAERPALVERRLDGERDQVGFGRVRFADVAVAVGAGRVEVAQHRGPDRAGRRDVGQEILDRQLGAAIDVDRPRRLGLLDRQLLRHAIDRAGAGEHDAG